MAEIRRYEFNIHVSILGTRRQAGKVRDSIWDALEESSLDWSDQAQGITVEVTKIQQEKKAND